MPQVIQKKSPRRSRPVDFYKNCHKYCFDPRRMPMKHENAWNYVLDEFGDTPVGDAAAQCKPIAYNDDHRNRTFTILAPNKRIAFMVDTPCVVNHLKSFLDLIGDLELKLVVQVENTEDGEFPEYAVFGGWAQVLETLRDESPRASFDTWMRETWPVSLSDGILTVGARNAYAAEWLSNRVSERAGELASTLLGETVKVNFVCAKSPESGTLGEDDEGEQEDSPLEHQSVRVEQAAATAYQDEVDTHEKIYLPGYALRLLWHGDLTPKEMSLWVAFRQSTYYAWSKGKKAEKNIPYWDVLRFANMSRVSFEREISGKDSIAGDMVKILPGEISTNPDPRYANARRYVVQVNPRLSSRDCNALHTILYRAVIEAGSIEESLELAEQTMTALVEDLPSSYLNVPENQEFPASRWPKSVAEIVRMVTGHKGDMPESVLAAAEKLQDRIINGLGNIPISLYFLREAAPRIGLSQPQMWAVITLRYRVWRDHQDGDSLGYAVFFDGLDELAKRVGATQRTVKNWLLDPAFCVFAVFQDTDGIEFPEKWPRKAAIFDVRLTEPTGREWAEFSENWKKWYTELEKVIHGTGKSDTRVWKKWYTELEKVIHGFGKNDTRLKRFILNIQTNTTKNQESPQNPRLAAQNPGRSGSQAYWDWDSLVARNGVTLAMSKKLLIANKKAGQDISRLCRSFVSWLLYAYSADGRGIEKPVANALARLNENIYSTAGGDFNRLAALPPTTLRAYIDFDLASRELPGSLQADIYKYNFANVPAAEKSKLREALFDL
jgi:hypothetical protein